MRIHLSAEEANSLGVAADRLLAARIARDELIFSCWRAGAPLTEIALSSDISHETVRRIVARRMRDAA